jgi:hypothetical protein
MEYYDSAGGIPQSQEASAWLKLLVSDRKTERLELMARF